MLSFRLSIYGIQPCDEFRRSALVVLHRADGNVSNHICIWLKILQRSQNAAVSAAAIDAENQQQSVSMDVTATAENAVKVYSITVTPSVTAIESVVASTPAAAFGKVYSIDGKRLSAPQKGMNILKMSDGTTGRIVSK